MEVDVDVEEEEEEEERTKVRLKSRDGRRFTLSKSEASCSNALKTMIESFKGNNNSANECISLKLVDGLTLAQVVDWCKSHAGQEADEEASEDDVRMLNSIPEDELFRLMQVANYLDVRSLLNASCQTIAKRWEGMKVEEIRKKYNIEADFTLEEEHQMLLECKKLGLDS